MSCLHASLLETAYQHELTIKTTKPLNDFASFISKFSTSHTQQYERPTSEFEKTKTKLKLITAQTD